jgi:hypothetical protein
MTRNPPAVTALADRIRVIGIGTVVIRLIAMIGGFGGFRVAVADCVTLMQHAG